MLQGQACLRLGLLCREQRTLCVEHVEEAGHAGVQRIAERGIGGAADADEVGAFAIGLDPRGAAGDDVVGLDGGVDVGEEIELLMLDWSRGEEWGSYLSEGEGSGVITAGTRG